MLPEEILEYIIISREEFKDHPYCKAQIEHYNKSKNKMGPFKDVFRTSMDNTLKSFILHFVANNKGLSYTDIQEVMEDFSHEKLMELFK